MPNPFVSKMSSGTPSVPIRVSNHSSLLLYLGIFVAVVMVVGGLLYFGITFVIKDASNTVRDLVPTVRETVAGTEMSGADDLDDAAPGLITHCRDANNQPVKGQQFLAPGSCCNAQGFSDCSDQSNCAYCEWGNSIAQWDCEWGQHGDVDKLKYPIFSKSSMVKKGWANGLMCNTEPKGVTDKWHT